MQEQPEKIIHPQILKKLSKFNTKLVDVERKADIHQSSLSFIFIFAIIIGSFKVKQIWII